MRKVIPLIALLLVGCMSTGSIRRKPGSNVVLPATPNPLAALVMGALCLTAPPTGVVPTIGSAGPTTIPATAAGTTIGTVTGGTTTSLGSTAAAAALCSSASWRESGAQTPARPPQR